jgi:hypothetical protein
MKRHCMSRSAGANDSLVGVAGDRSGWMSNWVWGSSMGRGAKSKHFKHAIAAIGRHDRDSSDRHAAFGRSM